MINGFSDLDVFPATKLDAFALTKQGIRYTLSEPARREILDRLLELNHQRYAEEVKAGLHDKKKAKTGKKGTGRKKKSNSKRSLDTPEQTSLFTGRDQDE